MGELLIGGLLAIFSGVLGYVSGYLKDARERRNRRAVVATGLLSELRWLNSQLRQVAPRGTPIGDPLASPVLDGAVGELSLFGTAAAQAMCHFHSLLRDVRSECLTAERIRHTDIPQAFYAINRSVMVKAVFAANAIAALKRELIESGGELPAPIAELPVSGPDVPKLLPSPFETFHAPSSEQRGGPSPTS